MIMIFVCMDLDETIFSSETKIGQFRVLSFISSDQYYHLDHIALPINCEAIISTMRQDVVTAKVKLFYPRKHLNFFSKASQATGNGFCLFFITNGLYSKKSVNEMIKSACSIHQIAPPSELFNVYNRIDLFNKSSHEPDPHKVAQAKLRLMIRERSIQFTKHNNRHEEHSFFFVDDNDTNRRFVTDSLGAITIDPKEKKYTENINMLTSLADQEIAKTAAALAKAFDEPDVI